MKIGILKEIKTEENRVAMTPAGVDVLTRSGHNLLIEKNAGVGSGFSDIEYQKAGAEIVVSAKEIYSRAEMVMHVKEILPDEYSLLQKGQVVFTYLHLAADEAQTRALMASKCVAIAYETIQNLDGRLPLLQPMSEVAGRMATQEGAKYLEMIYGGRGVLLGGVPGVEPAKVLVLGGGVVGTNAAKMACGLGAEVTIMDSNLERLRYLNDIMPANCKTIMSSFLTLQHLMQDADLVIGSVLIPGAKAPKLITRDMLKLMKHGTVLVDVAIDQGGCFETSHVTKHSDPIYSIDGIIHYAVGNMPAAVPRTSTIALTNATLPYALKIANKGWVHALKEDKALEKGLNCCEGLLTNEAVGEAHDIPTQKWNAEDFL